MAQAATEDMLSISVIVGGVPLTGFAPGGAIRFVTEVADFTMRTGVGGLGSYTRVLNEAGTLSIDMLPTSDGNDALSLMLEFAKTRPGGALFATTVIDDTGRYSLQTQGAVIMKNPDPTIGDGSGVMTWDISSVKWTQFTGGRAPTPIYTFSEVENSALLPVRPSE